MKISRQTREIINIVLFFLVVGLLLTAFVIYPLNKTADLYARANIDEYNADSTIINDPAPYADSAFVIDTFQVESDGLTTLAVLHLKGIDSGWTVSRGTVMLLPSEDSTRDEFLEMASQLIDSGFSVIAMDLRATGRSGSAYHGEGYSESEDLSSVIHFLSLRELIHAPFTVVGFSLGGDASILAAHENEIIDRVIAIEPNLTTRRRQDRLKEKYDMYWLPFYRTVMWFWYGIRSGYAPPYRDLKDIKAVACQTYIIMEAESQQDEEVVTIRELSDKGKLSIAPPDVESVQNQVLELIFSHQ
ncbi:MAG: alpha/beta fold hydrolase [bacterium]|nr:alpha/beta fold hydrolase [bacterium]